MSGAQRGTDAPTPALDTPPPTNVPTLQVKVRDVLARNQQLEARIAELTAKLDAALNHRFGRRSAPHTVTGNHRRQANAPARSARAFPIARTPRTTRV